MRAQLDKGGRVLGAGQVIKRGVFTTAHTYTAHICGWHPREGTTRPTEPQVAPQGTTRPTARYNTIRYARAPLVRRLRRSPLRVLLVRHQPRFDMHQTTQQCVPQPYGQQASSTVARKKICLMRSLLRPCLNERKPEF